MNFQELITLIKRKIENEEKSKQESKDICLNLIRDGSIAELRWLLQKLESKMIWCRRIETQMPESFCRTFADSNHDADCYECSTGN